MIRHCVFIAFKPNVPAETISSLMREVAGLQAHVPGIVRVQVGDNVSPEHGMDKGFSSGFIIDFDSPATRDVYLAHPAHQEVAAKLVDAAIGGADGIFVFDMEI